MQGRCNFIALDGLVQEIYNSIAKTLELRLSGPLDGLVQERRNSIANALELRLSCPNPSICNIMPSPHLQFVLSQCQLTAWLPAGSMQDPGNEKQSGV